MYLDHAGTTLCARSAVEAFSRDIQNNLYGNPHSASLSSSLATNRIEDIRVKALQFFGADPDVFDLVFVANATAAIKLVIEGFREQEHGFWYGYHSDSHTSLVGARELARGGHRMFKNDEEVERWIEGLQVEDNREKDSLRLLGYPAQSNLNGRRLPLNWPQRLRSVQDGKPIYTLLDAAALVSTSPLDLSDPKNFADYIALSFYKIFGFPDIGALIVRKEAAGPLTARRYFGGGTVDMVASGKEDWHIKKQGSIHEQLEDGTLPFHSIVALESAMDVHQRTYGCMKSIALHTGYLAKVLYDRLSQIKHSNGKPVCSFHTTSRLPYGDSRLQGPIIAFNFLDDRGNYVSHAEVEKLAGIKGIHIRSGGLCNPGGVASALDLEPWELQRNFSAGHRCGQESDLFAGKPAGLLRVSFGAMSNIDDARKFLDFVHEFFVESRRSNGEHYATSAECSTTYHVESLMVYPIKSCAGWQVPPVAGWDIRAEGLAWDREWCIVHQGTRKALSQKKYPRMALLRPSINLETGQLNIYSNGSDPIIGTNWISVPLSADPCVYHADSSLKLRSADVCGDAVLMKTYASKDIARFFTSAIGTPCTLARFPPSSSEHSSRHSKPHINKQGLPRSILLSNESPILIISRSSVNRLNEQIKLCGGKAVHASAFRANIVLAEDRGASSRQEQPYAEDHWQSLRIGDQFTLDTLGPCRRCQMVCIDQVTAEKNEQPFVTLAKTRKQQGKVYFGVHAAISQNSPDRHASIRVRDSVKPLIDVSHSAD